MTQRSLPQDGIAPAQIDAGAYDSATDVKRTRFIGQSIDGYYSPVTDGLSVWIDNINNTNKTLNLNANPGEARIDGTSFYMTGVPITFNLDWNHLQLADSYMVVQLLLISNRTASLITESNSSSGHSLFFPTDLTDYENAASVPVGTSRLACIVAPISLISNPNYLWHIVGGGFAQVVSSFVFDLDAANVSSNENQLLHPVLTNTSVMTFNDKDTGVNELTVSSGMVAEKVAVVGEVHQSQESLPNGIDVVIQLTGLNLGAAPEQHMFLGSADITQSSANSDKIHITGDGNDIWRHVLYDIKLVQFKKYVYISGTVSYFSGSQGDVGIDTIPGGNEAAVLDVAGVIYTDTADVNNSRITNYKVIDFFTPSSIYGSGSLAHIRVS